MNGEKSTRRQSTEGRRQKTQDRSLFSVLCALMLMGCAEQQRDETVELVYVQHMNKAQVMQIAEDVLAEMHFTVEKADVESGIIRTRPLSAAQFFEFWRSDNVGTFNAAEANLHSIRRIAELRLSQEGAEVSIGCDVQVQRLELPEQQFEISTSKFQISNMAWVDLGQDQQLATEILKRIEERIMPRVASSGSQTSDESRRTRDEK